MSLSRCISVRTRGFTLIELVVAIAIFAVLAVLAYGGLRNTMNARERITQHQDALASIETAFTLLETDIANAIPRGARDELGGSLPALGSVSGSAELEFTRYVDDGFGDAPVTRLKRVTWELAGNQLVRKTWPVLDRVPGTEPSRRILLDEVASLAFRFRDKTWVDYWPQASASVSGENLPRAVEVSIRFMNGDGARRILLVEAGS